MNCFAVTEPYMLRFLKVPQVSTCFDRLYINDGCCRSMSFENVLVPGDWFFHKASSFQCQGSSKDSKSKMNRNTCLHPV